MGAMTEEDREEIEVNHRMKKAVTIKRKLWWKILIAIVIAIVSVVLGIGNFMVTYAIGRSGDGANREEALEVEGPSTDAEARMEENREIQKELTDAFLEAETENPIEITSEDGLILRGGYFDQDSHNWVIIIHGYRSNHTHNYGNAQRYFEEGFNVLMPDLRACGESEGDYVGMGWLDRKDILNWIDWILSEDPNAQIVLHGTSMGGATAMMTAGEDTPDAVVAFVEDCGYSSVQDIFGSELKVRFHLPKFPVLYSAGMIAKLRAGYTFGEASSLKQLQKCEKPMLFIHGTQDDFVPFEMEHILYEACPVNDKKEVVAEGAGHGEASLLLGDEYWSEVFAFLDSYME